ncbi:cupin domain-containing protein [Desulfovibrio sp. ZJ369]|uniref:(R)-mandelonitrile lyase n=1 Tax=Desulfovibrio sp. ZJ369 TaxID=2709793 RepID=UPI0013EA6053|nr:cupin domain-containing protein [Desulfovibrio sp. ZJ369]
MPRFVLFLSCFFLLLAAGSGQAAAQDAATGQTVTRAGAQAALQGPESFFTGAVRVQPLFPANDAAHFSGAYVTFEPGARTAWHTHPAGQHLVVVSGVGLTQAEGGPITEIRAGDVIWCPPQVRHWHGASPRTAMTHMALTGTRDGKNVVWMEKVTDQEYNGR